MTSENWQHLTDWLGVDFPQLDADAVLSRFVDRGFCYQDIYDAIDHGLTCADTLRRVLDLAGQTLDAFLMSAEGGVHDAP